MAWWVIRVGVIEPGPVRRLFFHTMTYRHAEEAQRFSNDASRLNVPGAPLNPSIEPYIVEAESFAEAMRLFAELTRGDPRFPPVTRDSAKD